jgi:hypothetical protein
MRICTYVTHMKRKSLSQLYDVKFLKSDFFQNTVFGWIPEIILHALRNCIYGKFYRPENKETVSHGNCFCTANCRTKSPGIFRGTLRILPKISKLCLFILRLLWEPLTMFCETLIGEHCPKNFVREIRLAVVRIKSPAIFRETLEILPKISKLYLFILRLLWEPLTMFCETLIGEHCPKNLLEKYVWLL